jgi:hypothetical protein
VVCFEDKCYVPVYLQHSRFNALLDTGSSISAINVQAFNKLKNVSNKIKRSDISKITGAGGASHQVNGKLEIQIKIAGLNLEHTFYVIDDLCQQATKSMFELERKNVTFARIFFSCKYYQL